MSFTHVDKPFSIRGLELKNRVVRSAHGTNFGAGTMSDDLIAYHEARARGGVALSFIEIMSVHPSSSFMLHPWTPGVGEGFARLVAACKPHGMRLFQQLWHGGHHGMNADGGPPWSSSDVASSKIGVVPVPMTQGMMNDVIAGYANTARLCEEWGLDGVEIHCAHGYLPGQFLSPATNLRTDDYGGSFENRVRFMRQTVEAVRAAVSRQFIVGVRVAPDWQVGSLPPGEVLRAVQHLEERDLIDFVDVSAGNYQTDFKMIGGMHEPVGYELATSVPATRHIRSARIVAGRYRTLDDADLAIREDSADLVVMTRATIADPDLVVKSLAGEGTRVRPCIGCNQACVGGIMAPGARMGCTVNPAVGFERSVDSAHPPLAVTRRRILVIGGGVAGMEAARIAALRGHEVILAEARSRLGGAVRIAAMAPTRHGIADIAIWQEQEIFALGVDVRLSTFIEAADVAALAPDAIIVATGSTPRLDGRQLSNPGEPARGMDRPHVLSSEDVFATSRDFGRAALVVDDVGHYEAMGVAEALLDRGLDVTFVTRHIGIGHQLDGAFMTTPTLARFDPRRFTLLSRSRLIAVEDDSAVVGPIFDTAAHNGGVRSVPADTVVFVSHNRPNRAIYDELNETDRVLHIVGDARSPRMMEAAIREGHMAGLAV